MPTFISAEEIDKERVEHFNDLGSLRDRHQVESVKFHLGPRRHLAGDIIRYLNHIMMRRGLFKASGQWIGKEKR